MESVAILFQKIFLPVYIKKKSEYAYTIIPFYSFIRLIVQGY